MYENDGFHPYEDNNDAQNRYEAQSSETSGNQWQQPLYQMPQQPEHTQPKKKHTAGHDRHVRRLAQQQHLHHPAG